ncbi:hypothetical protein D6774_02910 [Candidatus Woesearchaeota archaeon]|nr:MAG: hypothetical protein D6774_02910 [Candidatus Woesearchaeota archaeon]
MKSSHLLILGSIVAILYIVLASFITTTPLIWMLTRIFGLVSFFFLFATVFLGELRLLRKVKADLAIFKYHVPFAIASFYLSLLHGISAVADNYKWGKGLHISDYLGFNFSDKWLALLSLGVLAFYLLILISITSRKRVIQFIGYKRWKKIHYLSYPLFIIAFIHSVGLGTDLKVSALHTPISYIFWMCLWVILSLLLARILNTAGIFETQGEVNALIMISLLVILGGAVIGSLFIKAESKISSQQQIADTLSQEYSFLQKQYQAAQAQHAQLLDELSALQAQEEQLRGELKNG